MAPGYECCRGIYILPSYVKGFNYLFHKPFIYIYCNICIYIFILIYIYTYIYEYKDCVMKQVRFSWCHSSGLFRVSKVLHQLENASHSPFKLKMLNKTGLLFLNRMGISQNRGFLSPKSSILIGVFIINHPFWGTTIFGNNCIHSNNYCNTVDGWNPVNSPVEGKVVEIPWFLGFQHHPRWLGMGFQPSTVVANDNYNGTNPRTTSKVPLLTLACFLPASHVSSDQNLVICCIEGIILPSCMGIVIGHYKNPY